MMFWQFDLNDPSINAL